MQREIKKRATVYGLVAVISAIMLGAFAYNLRVYPPESQLLRTFSSYNELRSFLLTNARTQEAFPMYGPWDRAILTTQTFGGASAFVPNALTPKIEYSTTNIQVAGVDEADIVKTDGEHIYLVSDNKITILKAYPPTEAEVLSKITFNNDTYPVGIFVGHERLAVLGSKYTSSAYYESYGVDIKTFVNVYDISDKTSPVLLKNFTMTGSYFNSRMIGDYVYFVVSQLACVVNDTVILPKIYAEDWIREIDAFEIHYSDVSDNYFTFTTVVALNMQNTVEEPTRLTIMMGGTSNMYVSLNNIYITFPEPYGKTSIYRIRVEKSTIIIEAHGNVLGHELNQFSMDEYNNYFRIVTTTWVNGITQTSLYVLNMNMSIVGKLENLASGENFHSARFMGDRCYLVTFKKVDPLFVIDLSEPTNPFVLGELKIPGFSDYLHPYDETHLIGVGKETVEAEEGNFAWYQGVKISLFDVSNVTNPTQIANYTIGDRGTDSPILSDHKAFLFDKSKNLLVIPVLVAEIDESKYLYEVPPYAYGEPVWQGAYVFNLSLEGFVLKGRITHLKSGIPIGNDSYWVKRSLYIENVLYTVSDKKIKMNSLEDLTLINEINIP